VLRCRSALLFLLIYAGVALTMAGLLPLPLDPALRAVFLLMPALTALMVVASWHAAGAPWPSLKKPPRL